MMLIFILLLLFFICRHIFFLTLSLTLSWTIARFLDPFCTLSPAHCRVTRDTFIFCLLTASATVLSGQFLPYAPSKHFWHILDILAQPAFIKVVLGAGSYFREVAGLHTDRRNTDPAHLFVWFTVIHNLLYILNFYLCMSILQKFYLWWKLW